MSITGAVIDLTMNLLQQHLIDYDCFNCISRLWPIGKSTPNYNIHWISSNKILINMFLPVDDYWLQTPRAGMGSCGVPFSRHDDVIKWKHFPRYWPFEKGIHRSPVDSPHKGQWHRALMFTCIWALNKWLSKQSWGWWFETPSRSLWRHCNGSKQ